MTADTWTGPSVPIECTDSGKLLPCRVRSARQIAHASGERGQRYRNAVASIYDSEETLGGAKPSTGKLRPSACSSIEREAIVAMWDQGY